jgi:spore germination protein YaaH
MRQPIGRLAAVLATAGAVLATAGAVGARTPSPLARAAGACAGRSPAALHLSRLSGPRGRLSWRARASAGVVYRVMRSGEVLGQTRADWLVVRITPGRRALYTVQARYGAGGGRCSTTLRAALPFRVPGAVAHLHVVSYTAGGVVLGWRPARRGDAPVAGYRVIREGAVVGQTHRLRYALRLSSSRRERVEVIAADVDGNLGARGRTLMLSARRAAEGALPGAPTDLACSDVSSSGATISWVAARPGGLPIAGYRLFRDGRLVGQTSATSMRIGPLGSSHIYAITVATVDTAGRESQQTPPLRLALNHEPPEGPTELGALRVTDTSATLAWNAGAANEGTLVGYELFKDGAAVGVIHGQSDTVTLASERSYTFTVRALDSAGALSAPAPNLMVVTTHTPPSTPLGLTAEAVTGNSIALSWSPSKPVSGTIVGYRVFRNEVPVGQSAGTSMTLAGLAPSTSYSITVTAVDSLGAISEPTAPLTVQTAEPTPTHGHAQAFLLASTDQSFSDFEAHYQQIGVVYPTYFECGSRGAVIGKDDPLITQWALARKVEVLPRINCQNVAYEDSILNEPSVRSAMIERLSGLCAEDGYSGIQIDFEGAQPEERSNFTTFITMLAERLHGQGRKLSTIVTAKTYNVTTGRAAMYDDAALAAQSDYIFVLDWGLHWLTSGPGSIDEYGWFKKVAEYAATMPDRSRFTLGMPMYGIDWAGQGGLGDPGTPLEYSNILALESLYPGTYEWNTTALSPHFSYVDSVGVHHEVWYTDQQSIGLRAELAVSLGLGVGLWRLGNEDQGVWELPQLGGGG